MSTTKYIVNNVTGQTINGNLTINGNVTITGLTSSNGTGTYRALLSQTGAITGINLGDFGGGLIIGEQYSITTYESGDDFSNIAQVVSGNINETNCTFIATGDTPSNWTNSSELTSTGNVVVNVLENTLGFDIGWEYDIIGTGLYVGFEETMGSIYNTFPKNKTTIKIQDSFPFNGVFDGIPPVITPVVSSMGVKDGNIIFSVYDVLNNQYDNNLLYNTPIEIKINQDIDTTPIIISGSVTLEYPFTYASVDLFCNDNYIETFYGDNTQVSDISELILELNSNSETSYLGTFSDPDDGGILLTIPSNKVNQFCSNGTLRFEVFSDN